MAAPRALKVVARSPSEMVKYWKASTVMSTPTGSLTMPSHFSSAADSLFSRAWRSSGMITVGPVTTRMAPSTTATGHARPPT